MLEGDHQAGLSSMVKESSALHHPHPQEAIIDTTQSVTISFQSEGGNMDAAEVGNSVLSSDIGIYLFSVIQGIYINKISCSI